MDLRLEAWERDALALHPGLDYSVGEEVEAYVDLSSGTRSAWWVVAFYARDVWRRWHVGLIHGSLNLYADRPVTIVDPALFRLPQYIPPWIGNTFAQRWAEVEVCPVIVDGRALGFIIRNPSTDSPEYCETFAPTHLTSRLGLQNGDQIRLQVLPGTRPTP